MKALPVEKLPEGAWLYENKIRRLPSPCLRGWQGCAAYLTGRNGLAVRRQFVFAPEHPDDVFAFEWHVQHHEIRQWADHNNSLAFLGILNQDSLKVLPIPALEEDQIPAFKIPNRYLFQVGIEIEALAALWHLEPVLG